MKKRFLQLFSGLERAHGTYTLSGKTVTIDQTVRQYDNSTWAIKVTLLRISF